MTEKKQPKKVFRDIVILELSDLFLGGILLLIGKKFSDVFLQRYYIDLDLSFLTYVFIAFIIIGAVCAIYGLVFSIMHVCKNKDYSKSQKTKYVISLILLNYFYTPIYYTKHIMGSHLWWGIADVVCYIIIASGIIYSLIFDDAIIEILTHQEITIFETNDKSFSITINEDFTCQDYSDDTEHSYDVGCTNNISGETFQIYNYPQQHTSKIDETIKFHADQLATIYADDLISRTFKEDYDELQFRDGNTIETIIVGGKKTGQKSAFIIQYSFVHDNNYQELMSNIIYNK